VGSHDFWLIELTRYHKRHQEQLTRLLLRLLTAPIIPRSGYHGLMSGELPAPAHVKFRVLHRIPDEWSLPVIDEEEVRLGSDQRPERLNRYRLKV
jgi:hypothetical protein